MEITSFLPIPLGASIAMLFFKKNTQKDTYSGNPSSTCIIKVGKLPSSFFNSSPIELF